MGGDNDDDDDRTARYPICMEADLTPLINMRIHVLCLGQSTLSMENYLTFDVMGSTKNEDKEGMKISHPVSMSKPPSSAPQVWCTFGVNSGKLSAHLAWLSMRHNTCISRPYCPHLEWFWEKPQNFLDKKNTRQIIGV